MQMDMSNDIAFADVFRDSLIQGWANIRIDWGRFGGPDRVVECDMELNPLAAETWIGRGVGELELGVLIAHELGHCLNLQHTEPYPMPVNTAIVAPPGFFPSPTMAYSQARGLELTENDRVAVSLLYPAPGFLGARGTIGGPVFLNGTPVRFAYVQAVEAGSRPRPGAGPLTTWEKRCRCASPWKRPTAELHKHSGRRRRFRADNAADPATCHLAHISPAPSHTPPNPTGRISPIKVTHYQLLQCHRTSGQGQT